MTDLLRTITVRRRFHAFFFLGLVFLALANVTRVVLERHSSLAEDPRDGIVGLLFGVAFGWLILSMWTARGAA